MFCYLLSLYQNFEQPTLTLTQRQFFSIWNHFIPGVRVKPTPLNKDTRLNIVSDVSSQTHTVCTSMNSGPWRGFKTKFWTTIAWFKVGVNCGWNRKILITQRRSLTEKRGVNNTLPVYIKRPWYMLIFLSFFCYFPACDPGWYGVDCGSQCGHCDGGACDVVNGTCPGGYADSPGNL